jgi:hypothetical protein
MAARAADLLSARPRGFDGAMWRLLTGGIKAILAITALAVAAQWATRTMPGRGTVAAVPEPAVTGTVSSRAKPSPLDQHALQRLIREGRAGR